MQKKFLKTEHQICGDCKATGRVWMQIREEDHYGNGGKGEYVTCTTCEGSGMVNVTRDVTVTVEPYKQTDHEQ